MSLEIFPTYPKIRADQIEGIGELIARIEDAVNSAVNDANVARVINTGALTRAAINNLIRALVNQSFLDPLVAGLVGDETSQTRSILDAIISNAIASAALGYYNGQVDGGSVDWNTLTTRGYYRITASGAGGSHCPPVIPQDGTLLVLTEGSDSPITQIFFGDNGAYALRSYYGSQWSAWYASPNIVMAYQTSGIEFLDSTDYRTLTTFTPSRLIWPVTIDTLGAPPIKIQVFGQLLYVGRPDTVTYIRLSLQDENNKLGQALVKATMDGTYTLAWAGYMLPPYDGTLIIEARTTNPDPKDPPRFVYEEEGALATQFVCIF